METIACWRLSLTQMSSRGKEDLDGLRVVWLVPRSFTSSRNVPARRHQIQASSKRTYRLGGMLGFSAGGLLYFGIWASSLRVERILPTEASELAWPVYRSEAE